MKSNTRKLLIEGIRLRLGLTWLKLGFQPTKGMEKRAHARWLKRCRNLNDPGVPWIVHMQSMKKG